MQDVPYNTLNVGSDNDTQYSGFNVGSHYDLSNYRFQPTLGNGGYTQKDI